MVNSYSMCRRNFKWTTKLFFHLLDVTVLNSWILLYSYGAKCTHRDFRFLLARNLIGEAGRSKFAPPPVWLEGQVRLQQMLWEWTAAITSTGQQNPVNCPAVFVQRGVSEGKPRISVQNVMWVFKHEGANPCILLCFNLIVFYISCIRNH